MRTKVGGSIGRIFPPAIVAGIVSFVPPLMASGWKILSPGYHCPIRGGLAGAWESPCMPVVFFAAWGAGWVIDRVASRIANGLPSDKSTLERIDRIRFMGLIAAAAVGLVLGVPLAANVLNPCP